MLSPFSQTRRSFIGATAAALGGAGFGVYALGRERPCGSGPAEELAALGRATGWLNSPPLSATALRGKVVLIDVCTYTCINWLRTLPYVREWDRRYREHGLVVIGVHAPEFTFEHDIENVRRAVRAMRIAHPLALDNDFAIWRAFNNRYWPSRYLLDAAGRIRHHHFGEGEYEGSERKIMELLSAAGARGVGSDVATVTGHGIEAAADWRTLKSAETYLGYERPPPFEFGVDHAGRASPLRGSRSPATWSLGAVRRVDRAVGIDRARPGERPDPLRVPRARRASRDGTVGPGQHGAVPRVARR
jgi:hypothetical protein